MAKHIIGIHGLSNKPKESDLAKWWLQAINDGLKKVHCPTIEKEQFSLVYWASSMHYPPDTDYEPYTLPDTDQYSGERSGIIAAARVKLGDVFGRLTDALKDATDDSEVIHAIKQTVKRRVVADLAQYNDPNSTMLYGERKGQPTRAALRALLSDVIEARQGDEIMLISHSMGTIIAYDVLRGMDGTPSIVSHFVTLGSPLGLAEVKKTIRDEWDAGLTPLVPTCITDRWVNMSDPKDPVCADMTLNGEYKSSGTVDVHDEIVSNGYSYTRDGEIKRNHHKSYGYLRTPEIAQIIKSFLTS